MTDRPAEAQRTSAAPQAPGTAPATPATPGSPSTKGPAQGPLPGRPVPRGGPGHGGLFGLGMPAEKSLQFGPSAARLLRRLRPERTLTGVVVLLATASVVLSVIGPKILGHATDIIFSGVIGRRLPAGVTASQVAAAERAKGNGSIADMVERMNLVPGQGIDFTALRNVLLVVLGLYIGASVLSWLQGYVLAGVVQRTILQLRADVEHKLHRLPLRYFDQQPRGEVLSRVTNDIDNISQTLSQTLSQLLTSLLTVIGVLTMMFVISPLLAVIALVSIPVSVFVTRVIASKSQPRFIAQWRYTGELNAQIEEAFTGHALVKVFGRQSEVEASFGTKNDELYRAGFGAQFVSGLIMPMMMFLGNLSYVAVAVVGGLRITSGAITLGDVQAFIQYSRQFTQPLTQVASMANLLQSGVASAERVFELLDEPEESSEPLRQPAVAATRGRVEMSHVSFRYVTEQPLIQDLSLVAEPGQTVAIVGPTGAGKTTLVNLVMRFYEIDDGRITLDGVDTASMSRQALRSRIGMVLQDTWLFNGTIRDNIAYGRPGATEEEIAAAASAAYVDRFVHTLPDGYDTVIDEEGSNVSAGEKQLITIARAFLSDPSLLILDEATSSVDTRTEVLVQHAMASLRRDRTSFVIAHRLSTIRDADLILVMEAGRIVEQGTHEELLKEGGAYFRLYDAQFAAPVPVDG